MTMRRNRWSYSTLLGGLLAGLGCSTTPAEPLDPAWINVAPIFQGECDGCHDWNAAQTGGGYRFDFFDVSVCGDAALAVSNVILAGTPGPSGTPLAAPLIAQDILTQPGASWPRMPPQPSPALPKWERDTLENWALEPAKGTAPAGNQAPTITTYQLPPQASSSLSFTAVLDDPDGDPAIGVIETTNLVGTSNVAFLMNRLGSFEVDFDTSQWPAGSVSFQAVLCDGWTKTTIPSFATVQIVR